MKLQIIIGSTRPERVSPKLAKWVAAEVENLDDTTAEIVDLADYTMPFFDEPKSPRYNPDRRINEPASKWLTKLGAGDAYVFVTPEYNHSVSGVLKNALDYVTGELSRKPATAVAHGTVGGARAIMHLKEILSESQAAVIPKSVAFAGAGRQLDDDGVLSEDVSSQAHGPQFALKIMLAELKWYSDALSAARSKD